MEASNLNTAASYVNNLLLARGLLRNGKSVEFGRLATYTTNEPSDSKKQPTAAPIIVADIINLVHDLILKRDRDADHNESLASTLRTLRTESTRTQSDLDRLKTRNADLRRQLALSESTQRAAETTAKRAESSARALRDELAKAKKIVEQVRTQCANDIRKRDVQLSKLKGHLDARGQQRGANKGGAGGLTITITPGKTGVGNAREEQAALPSVEDERYNLRQETTEFLTQLSQGLSDENDQLIGLIRSTLATLRELQGLPHNQPKRLLGQQSRGGLSSGGVSIGGSEEAVDVTEVSYETLSRDLEHVLGSLSDLLTNPSFAPIEEVHIRDEEISRLREGWEKMEKRWQEAMGMMQGWRKRLINGGDTIRLDELKMGLTLGDGLDSPSRRPFALPGKVEETADDAELVDEEVSSEEREDSPDVNDLPVIEDELGANAEKPLFEALPSESYRSSRPIFGSDDNALNDEMVPNDDNALNDDSAAEEPALREADPNTLSQPSPIHDRLSHLQLSDTENASPLPERPRFKAAASTTNKASKASTSHPKPATNLTNASKSSTNLVNGSRPTSRPTSRIPSRKAPIPKTLTAPPKHSPPAPDRSLSVSEKLQLAEKEARRMSSSPLNLNGEDTQRGPESPLEMKASRDQHAKSVNGLGIEDQVDGQVSRVGSLRKADTARSPAKKTRIGGRPRRRKSTLSPDELEGLMMGR